ncbi:MAG TPA: response regulator [Methylomirabilota bacterium]|nr:response regulator [Methylomirabilota bacterium]
MREVPPVSGGQEQGDGAPNILLLEDNPADVRLLFEAFRESPLHPHIEVAEDGEQALALLQRHDHRTGALRPDLLLLDLRTPKKSGLAVLTEVRADPALQDLPAMILTSSLAKEDRQKAAALGVERFLHKPADLEAFFLIAREVAEWWRRKSEEKPLVFHSE